MDAGEAPMKEILAWLREERERLASDIERFSSGNAQLMQRRSGRFVDVTGEKLKELHRRTADLDGYIARLAQGPAS